MSVYSVTETVDIASRL